MTMGVFQQHGATVGLITVRSRAPAVYLWESAGQSAFEGSTFFTAFTIGRITK